MITPVPLPLLLPRVVSILTIAGLIRLTVLDSNAGRVSIGVFKIVVVTVGDGIAASVTCIPASTVDSMLWVGEGVAVGNAAAIAASTVSEPRVVAIAPCSPFLR